MTGVVIASKNSNPTVRRLEQGLDAEVKTDSFDGKGKFVVRWGSTYRIKNPKAVLNKQKAIENTVAKLDMLKKLADGGVRVPYEVLKPPCVARWNEGSRGSGLQFCMKQKEMEEAKENGAGVFLEWIPIKTEYRFHIICGLIISISEKVKMRHADKYIRSASHGWSFRDTMKLKMPDGIDLISSALAAVQVLGLDFGAVDIAMTKHNIPVVFEVNTAPGLNPERASKYIESIEKWLALVQN